MSLLRLLLLLLLPLFAMHATAEAPPRPLVVNLRDQAWTAPCERVLEVVPADPAARGPLRERWKQYQALGYALDKHDM